MSQKINKKELGIGLLKGFIGVIPSVGTLLNEVLFDTRARIKQERLNSFIIEFGEFIKNKLEFVGDLNEFDQENFSDVFEEILISVTKTNARHKINIFKKILLKQFDTSEKSSDDTLRYINLTNSITLFQFNILTNFNSLSDKVQMFRVNIVEAENDVAETQMMLQKEIRLGSKGFANNSSLYEERIKASQQSIKSKRKAVNENINPSDHNLYNLGQENFIIEIHDLIGKGLLQDLSLETVYISPLELFKITRLGRKYMEYVQDS